MHRAPTSRSTALALLVAVLAGIGSSASACRSPFWAAERIAQGQFDAVALVRVVGAEYVGDRKVQRGWRGTASVERLLKGTSVDPAVAILGGRGSAMCEGDDGPPSPGERRVAYIMTGGRVVSYPLDTAMKLDPWLRKLLEADFPGGASR